MKPFTILFLILLCSHRLPAQKFGKWFVDGSEIIRTNDTSQTEVTPAGDTLHLKLQWLTPRRYVIADRLTVTILSTNAAGYKAKVTDGKQYKYFEAIKQ